jgi:hypothetical protein
MGSLPLVIYVLMLEIAVGTFAVLIITDFKGETGRSFLITGGLSALACAGIARWTANSVTFQAGEALYPTDVFWRSPQDFFLNLSIVALFFYNIMIGVGTDIARRSVGVFAVGTLAVTLFCNSMLYRGEYLSGLIAPLSLFAGTVSLGAVLTGMLLGHWYLVTPTMAVSALSRLNTVWFWALVAQAVIVVINIGPWVGGSADKMWQDFAAFFWLRVLVGIAFPLILAVATWQTCKLKAHMSSTGFLYVGLACVLGGEIVSRVIQFQTGVPL